jgi:hypothetical protein
MFVRQRINALFHLSILSLLRQGSCSPLTCQVERTIKSMAPKKDDIRAKLLLGLNFYGMGVLSEGRGGGCLHYPPHRPYSVFMHTLAYLRPSATCYAPIMHEFLRFSLIFT